jgi:flagellar motility protein MotE (MotC chaperone)
LLALQQKSDSITFLLGKLQDMEKKLLTAQDKSGAQPVNASSTDTLGTTKDRKLLVKMLEAMSPENAAKVLESFKDTDAKSIILGIKSRQAGKILSAMAPDRAGKLMR